MNKEIPAIGKDMGYFAADARELIATTVDLAEDKIGEARKSLVAAVDHGNEFYEHIREQAVAGAKYTDDAVYMHPYQVIGMAVGLGALIGFLLSEVFQ